MIAARQELDLRPQLERLDRLICWSEGIDEGALGFAFRPLWQLDEPAKAALALSRAQATQVYAGLGLWPDAVMARLAEAQLVADGTYPNAAAVFADAGAFAATSIGPTFDYDPNELRNLTDPGRKGQWMARGESGASNDPDAHLTLVAAEDPDPTPEEQEEELRKQFEEREDPQRYFRQRFEQNGRIRIPPRPGGSGAPAVKPPPMGGGSEAPVDPETPKTGAGSAQTSSGKTPGTTGLPATPTIVNPAGSTEPAQSTAVRPRPLTPQSGSPPSFNGRLAEPAKPGNYGASRALASIKIPSDLRLDAQGETASDQGKSYQEEVRKALNFNTVPKPPSGKFQGGDSAPDGLLRDQVTGLQVALEVKYFNKVRRGINDPDNMLKFISADDVAQARKYLDEFKGGLLWIVNDRELVYKYDYLFRKNGLSGFRIEYIESK